MKGSGTRRSEKILLPSRAVPASTDTSMDLVTLGQRLRHLRRAKGLTLDQLSAAVGRAPSQLSLIENGKREPKLSVLQAIAAALGVGVQDLLRPEAPSRRAGLEIELAHFQQEP